MIDATLLRWIHWSDFLCTIYASTFLVIFKFPFTFITLWKFFLGLYLYIVQSTCILVKSLMEITSTQSMIDSFINLKLFQTAKIYVFQDSLGSLLLLILTICFCGMNLHGNLLEIALAKGRLHWCQFYIAVHSTVAKSNAFDSVKMCYR